MSHENNNEKHNPTDDIKKKVAFFVLAVLVLVVAKFALGL